MKLPTIDLQQKQQALKILTAVVYLIEQEQNSALNLMDVELDLEEKWEQDCYLIQTIKYPVGTSIKVTNREGTLEIEMLANALLKAEGITSEDCDYWSQIYSVETPLICENPL